jgi:hypothetical protein
MIWMFGFFVAHDRGSVFYVFKVQDCKPRCDLCWGAWSLFVDVSVHSKWSLYDEIGIIATISIGSSDRRNMFVACNVCCATAVLQCSRLHSYIIMFLLVGQYHLGASFRHWKASHFSWNYQVACFWWIVGFVPGIAIYECIFKRTRSMTLI